MKRVLVALAALTGVLLVGFVVVLGIFYIKAHPEPYKEVQVDAAAVPRWGEVRVPFSHQYDKTGLPFLASAVIDLDGDGTPELFFGGGAQQKDVVLRFKGGTFVSAAALAKQAYDATHGAAVLDVDGDGRSDLILARQSGLYLFTNRSGTLSGKRVAVTLPERSVPLSLATGDVNGDGFVDLFLACYLPREHIEGQNIFNKQGYGASSVLLLNKGDNSWKNITREAGLFEVHNTLGGMFVDLDGDRDQDLVVAQDSGNVRTFRNNGDLKFTRVDNPTSSWYGYPMGIAAGDYNNDGRVDLFFSNIGTTVPRLLAKGDLRDDQPLHPQMVLLRNEGDFKFTDVAKEARVADYEFSWGVVMEDLNLDGRQDLILAQNYVGFPGHKFFRLPGRLLLQRQGTTFAAAETQAGVQNRNFAISPLVADWNGDGHPDLVLANLAGQAKAFVSKAGKSKYLKVALPDQTRSIGAKVVVETASGRKLHGHFITNEGLCSDSSHVLTFGLDNESGVKQVTVQYPSGATAAIGDAKINSLVVVKAAEDEGTRGSGEAINGALEDTPKGGAQVAAQNGDNAAPWEAKAQDRGTGTNHGKRTKQKKVRRGKRSKRSLRDTAA